MNKTTIKRRLTEQININLLMEDIEDEYEKVEGEENKNNIADDIKRSIEEINNIGETERDPKKRFNQLARIVQGLGMASLFMTISKAYGPALRMFHMKFDSFGQDVDSSVDMAGYVANEVTGEVAGWFGYEATSFGPNFDDAQYWALAAGVLFVLSIAVSVFRKGGSFKKDIKGIWSSVKGLFGSKTKNESHIYTNFLIAEAKYNLKYDNLLIEGEEGKPFGDEMADKVADSMTTGANIVVRKAKQVGELTKTVAKKFNLDDWNSPENKKKREKIAQEASSMVTTLSKGLSKSLTDKDRGELIQNTLTVGTYGAGIWGIVNLVIGISELSLNVGMIEFAAVLFLLRVLHKVLTYGNKAKDKIKDALGPLKKYLSENEQRTNQNTMKLIKNGKSDEYILEYITKRLVDVEPIKRIVSLK